MKQMFLVTLNTVFIVGMSTEEIYLKILLVLLTYVGGGRLTKQENNKKAEPVITSSILGQNVISPIKSLRLSSTDCKGIGCHGCSINMYTV